MACQVGSIVPAKRSPERPSGSGRAGVLKRREQRTSRRRGAGRRAPSGRAAGRWARLPGRRGWPYVRPRLSRKPPRSQASRSLWVGSEKRGGPSSSLSSLAGARPGRRAAGDGRAESRAPARARVPAAFRAGRRPTPAPRARATAPRPSFFASASSARGASRPAWPPGGRVGREVPLGVRTVHVLEASAQRVVRQPLAAVGGAPRDDELDELRGRACRPRRYRMSAGERTPQSRLARSGALGGGSR